VVINAAATFSAGTVALTAGDLQVDGGAVTTRGMLTLGSIVPDIPGPLAPLVASSSLDISNHVILHLGSLAIVDRNIDLDATSTLEIGNADSAPAGTVTVDPGAELTGGDFFASLALPMFSSPVLNNGNIRDNGFYNLGGVTNNGTIEVQIADTQLGQWCGADHCGLGRHDRTEC
jgi:hypothetical protein